MAKKERVIRKIDIEIDERAIKRGRRNKIIGKVLACVVVLIYLGAIAGSVAGAYNAASKAWWENVGREADVEFKELFTLFNGFSDADEKKIVTKSYSNSDLEDFYCNLKRKMFLADDSELSVSGIISAIMSSPSSQSGASNMALADRGTDGYDLEVEEETPLENPNGGGESFTTGSEELDKLLQEIQFDFSSLTQYDGEKYILEISDRQLAAVVNDAFSALSGSFEGLAELEDTLGKPLNELVEVKQIVIGGNELSVKDTSLRITLSVKARGLLSNLLTQYNIPPIVNSILPKQLYATAIVYPNDPNKAAQIAINRMGEAKFDKIVRIIDVILKKTGNDMSLGKMLTDVNSKVVEVLNKAQEKLPIAFVPTGSVDLYPIESLMGIMNVEISEQAFLYMLRDIKLPTADSLGIDILAQEEKTRRVDAFVGELSEKYCLDNSDSKITSDNTIKNVMDFAGSDDAVKSVRLTQMKFPGEYSAQALKVRAPYKVLAGMLSDYVVGEGMMGDIKADLVGMSYTTKGEILSVDVRVDLAEMLGFNGEGVMASLIKQLVPQYVFVSADVCVNAELETPTRIVINKTKADDSKTHLATLTALAGKFGMDVSTLSYENICEKIDKGLKDGLSQMQEKIGCEIVFTQECAYLPNVFEVVCGAKMLDETPEKHIEPSSLYMIMKQVNTFELADEDKNKTDNAKDFIKELEGKYYLLQGKIVDEGDGRLLESVMGLKDNFGQSVDKDALAKDNRATSDIYPLMSAGEFAYVLGMNLNLTQISDTLKSARIIGASSTAGELRLYVSAELYETNGKAENNGEAASDKDLSQYSNLIPQTAYLTMTADMSLIGGADGSSCVSVTIDGMEDEHMSDFFSIVRKLAGKNIDKSEIESNIDRQVKDYMSRINGIDYQFVDGGLRIDNIFNVMAKSDMVKSKDPQERVFRPDEIRYLLRTLYGYDLNSEGRGGFSAADNLDGFIDGELYSKYFISDSFGQRLKTYEQKDTLLDGFSEIGGSNFNAGNVRMKDLTSLVNVTDIEGKSPSELQSEITQKFNPKFTKEEFAHLLSTHVSVVNDISFMSEQEIVYVDNDEYTMTLTLRGKGNLQDENAKGLIPQYLYVNVIIELGEIKSDGARSDMDVYQIDINSLRRTADGGEEQDLDLLMTFIERIKSNTQKEEQPPTGKEDASLDGIVDKLEKNLNDFKKQIHNDVFTVSFLADGGFMFNETIYKIALNSVYGVAAYATADGLPDEINFRNGLCKINNMPSKFRYSDNVYIDFENGNRASSSAASIAQINDKYALARQLKDDLAILSTLGEYAKDYATNIDGEKLTSSEKRGMSVEQLRPEIVGEELLLMLEKSVMITADGYKDAIMTALYILDGGMLIVYQSDLNLIEENAKYADLLPAKVALVVNIDVEKLYVSDAICTQIGINDLSDGEAAAIQSLVQKLNQKGSGESKNLDEANEECSRNVRSTMSGLTDNMRVRFVAGKTAEGVTEGGKLILDSIYEIAAGKINEADPSDKINAEDVKGMLEALFDNLGVNVYEPPKGLTEEQLKVTYTTNEWEKALSNLYMSITSNGVNISGAVGDWNLASMISVDGLTEALGLKENAAGKSDALTIKNSALIPTIADGNGGFNAIRQTLKVLKDEEYYLLTMDVDMETAVGERMSILPQRMDLTAIINIASKDVTILYGNLTDRQKSILTRLIDTNRSEGVRGLDTSNTDAVREEILGMKIIEEEVYGNTFVVTLGDILGSGGNIMPIEEALKVETRADNVVLGVGAIVVDMRRNI